MTGVIETPRTPRMDAEGAEPPSLPTLVNPPPAPPSAPPPSAPTAVLADRLPSPRSLRSPPPATIRLDAPIDPEDGPTQTKLPTLEKKIVARDDDEVDSEGPTAATLEPPVPRPIFVEADAVTLPDEKKLATDPTVPDQKRLPSDAALAQQKTTAHLTPHSLPPLPAPPPAAPMTPMTPQQPFLAAPPFPQPSWTPQSFVPGPPAPPRPQGPSPIVFVVIGIAGFVFVLAAFVVLWLVRAR
jgi:hypothetical protein